MLSDPDTTHHEGSDLPEQLFSTIQSTTPSTFEIPTTQMVLSILEKRRMLGVSEAKTLLGEVQSWLLGERGELWAEQLVGPLFYQTLQEEIVKQYASSAPLVNVFYLVSRLKTSLLRTC